MSHVSHTHRTQRSASPLLKPPADPDEPRVDLKRVHLLAIGGDETLSMAPGPAEADGTTDSETADVLSLYDNHASEATRAARQRFEAAWHPYQYQRLNSSARHAWNFVAGALGQFVGTGQGALASRLTNWAVAAAVSPVVGPAAAGVAGIAAGSVAGVGVAAVFHTVFSEPLQAMVRDTTVDSPYAELQATLFRAHANAATDRFRAPQDEPPAKFAHTAADGSTEWLDAATWLQRGESAAARPGLAGAWAGKVGKDDLPYWFGDGLVGSARALVRESDPAWWATRTGRLAEASLHLLLLGPLAGSINHALSQYWRRSGIGVIGALRQRHALLDEGDEKASFAARLDEAQRRLAELRTQLAKAAEPDQAALRGQIAVLVGDGGATEHVTLPRHLRPLQVDFLQSWFNDLDAALKTATDDAVAIRREWRAVGIALRDARAKSQGVFSDWQSRCGVLFQPQREMPPGEPDLPGRRLKTALAIVGKMIAMVPQAVAANVAGPLLHHPQRAVRMLACVVPPLAFVGAGLGWTTRTELAGGLRVARGWIKGMRLSAAGPALDEVVVDVAGVQASADNG